MSPRKFVILMSFLASFRPGSSRWVGSPSSSHSLMDGGGSDGDAVKCRPSNNDCLLKIKIKIYIYF